MPKVTHIDHIAIIVKNLEEAFSFWREALGMQIVCTKEIPAEQARVAFMNLGEERIEFIEPTSAESSLARFLEKRGPGMHHICLEVDDIESMLVQLKESSVQLINQTPETGSDGRKYVFIHPKSANGVLVELYEMV